MSVLHDWDEVPTRVDWARRRGLSLLLYSLANKFPFLKNISVIANNTRSIESEKLRYMETLIRIGQLAGVVPVFGIRDCVTLRYGKEIDVLRRMYDVDVRRHIHIGDPPDPARTRHWEPPLNQTRNSWGFDTAFIKGNKVELAPGELPTFHVDYPYQLHHYVDYLFEELEREV